MSFLVGIVLLAVVTAVACAIPGVFIVLRKNSMLVDAISHAVLPGIVVGYFLTQDLRSPLLILGAALAGLLVVLGSQLLTKTGLLSGDAPQGLVFPALFSLGIIMVSQNFGGVHLDVHTVLIGDLNLAAFDQLVIGEVSLGPSYLYLMLALLLINTAFVTLFWKQLTTSSFDAQFARVAGIRTGLINTAFMFLVSVTVTAAFYAAGAILVIGLIVLPAAIAYLFSNRVRTMLLLAVLIAATGAFGGFWLSYYLNTATSAGMAVFLGLLFAAALTVRKLQERASRYRLTQIAD